MLRSIRTTSVLAGAALLAATGCQNDLIEMCMPTAVELEVEDGVAEALLRSGDRPVRNKVLHFDIRAGDGGVETFEVETGGNGQAHLDLAASGAEPQDVTARFPGDDAYCESSDPPLDAPAEGTQSR